MSDIAEGVIEHGQPEFYDDGDIPMYLPSVVARGGQRFIFGLTAYGMGGESWDFCVIDLTSSICTEFGVTYGANVINGVRVAKTGTFAVAFGQDLLGYRERGKANFAIARRGDWVRWERTGSLNALGNITDLAISPDDQRLLLLNNDGVYTAAVDGSDLKRSAASSGARGVAGVAWLSNDAFAYVRRDGVLSFIQSGGKSAMQELPLAAELRPCAKPKKHNESNWEPVYWLSADPDSSLVLVGLDACGIRRTQHWALRSAVRFKSRSRAGSSGRLCI